MRVLKKVSRSSLEIKQKVRSENVLKGQQKVLHSKINNRFLSRISGNVEYCRVGELVDSPVTFTSNEIGVWAFDHLFL